MKNRVDTEVMLGVAGKAGYRVVPEADEAEVIVDQGCAEWRVGENSLVKEFIRHGRGAKETRYLRVIVDEVEQ